MLQRPDLQKRLVKLILFSAKYQKHTVKLTFTLDKYQKHYEDVTFNFQKMQKTHEFSCFWHLACPNACFLQ